MKSIFTNLIKKLDESKKAIIEKKNVNLRKLDELRIKFSKEIDQYITEFYRKRNLIKEALKQKTQLRKFKIGIFRYLTYIRIRYLISAPIIFSMIIPAVILHVFLEIYHHICFPLYGIPTIRARDYFVFDRQHLAYLNWMEKIFCIYCSYFNCLINYTREIAGLTELYWCPIKHAKRLRGAHNQYHLFIDYLEGQEYRKKQDMLRKIAEGKIDRDEIGL
ncbi:MAG: hypothetical protein WC806_00955 [Candidatus Gracilibacteria bacterium]